MGDKLWEDIGNEKTEILNSIHKLKYFENNNLKIKKIVCGLCISIFLTGYLFF
jgi:hypothetical protein